MKYQFNTVLYYSWALSAVVASLTVVIYKSWYPYPLYHANGADKNTVAFFAIAVLAVPVAVFFLRQKKIHCFSIFSVCSFQALLFCCGVFVASENRPVWIVFNVDRFDLVQAKDLTKKYLDGKKSKYFSESWLGPRWIASRIPEDQDSKNLLIFESAQGGPDLPQRVDLYLPLSDEVWAIRKKALELAELRRFNSPEEVDQTLKKWPDADSWLPMQAKSQAMVVLLRRSDASVLAIEALRPWD